MSIKLYTFLFIFFSLFSPFFAFSQHDTIHVKIVNNKDTIMKPVKLRQFSYSKDKPVLNIFDSSKVCDGYILIEDMMKNAQLIGREGNVLYNFPGNIIAFDNSKEEILAHVEGDLVSYDRDLEIIRETKDFIHHNILLTPEKKIMIFSNYYDSIYNVRMRSDMIVTLDSNEKELRKWETWTHREYLMDFIMKDKNIFLYKKLRDTSLKADFVLSRILPTLKPCHMNYSSKYKEIFHMNSVQVIPQNESEKKNPVFRRGNLLVSFCNYNDSIVSFMAVLDPVTYKILWYYVQPARRQIHSPLMLPNGNILVYINASPDGGKDSSYVDEVNPISKKVVWYFPEKFPTVEMRHLNGSCQRLPNGNTLISNRSGYIYEVTPDKKIVWQWLTSSTISIFRATLFSKDDLKWLVTNE